MADFSRYAPKLLQLEGGFVNHPNDTGGPTNKGVTLATYQRIFGQDKTVEDLKKMTDGEFRIVMDESYWKLYKGDEINNQSLAELMIDWGINSGIGGIRKAQEVAGVKPDGIVGPKTIAAFNSADQQELFQRIWNARHQYYINIVKRSPAKKVFMNGWMNRLNSFQFEE